MEKTELDVFTHDIVTAIKTAFKFKCHVGKKKSTAYYITCMDGEKKLLFHNITPLAISHKEGVLNHILQYLTLWKEGKVTAPINVNDDVCATLYSHIISTSGMKDALPKNVSKAILRKIKISINKYPQNINYILQGLEFYCKGKFITKYIKPKIVKHGIIIQNKNTKGHGKDESIHPIWPMAKGQGIVNNLSVPAELVKENEYYSTIVEIADAVKINPMSLVYTFMLIAQFGPPGYVIEEHKTHTTASKADIKDLAVSLSATLR